MKKIALLALAVLTFGTAFADAVRSKADFIGTWLLNGKDRSTKFMFLKDGSFVYKGTNAASKGKWAFNGSSVRLVWTEVDGQKVKPGSIKANYAVKPDGTLVINRFKYRKVSSK